MHKFKGFQLRWGEKLDPARGCYYLQRWVLLVGGWGLRLHRWLADDDQRHFHDHPWWMVILVLRGGYTDISPQGTDHVRAPAVRFRPAEHQHTVHLDPDRAWTLVLTGPKVRNHLFWVGGRSFRPLRYFDRHGHHQCDT